jgi:hypothetical protein
LNATLAELFSEHPFCSKKNTEVLSDLPSCDFDTELKSDLTEVDSAILCMQGFLTRPQALMVCVETLVGNLVSYLQIQAEFQLNSISLHPQ